MSLPDFIQDKADVKVLLTGREYEKSDGYAYTGTLCKRRDWTVAVLKFFWYEKQGGINKDKASQKKC